MKLITVKPSSKPDKKLVATISNGRTKRIHFGSKGSTTFINGASIEKKNAYIQRHKVNENWNEVNPGSLSRFLLWGNSRNLKNNINSYKNKFNL